MSVDLLDHFCKRLWSATGGLERIMANIINDRLHVARGLLPALSIHDDTFRDTAEGGDHGMPLRPHRA
jgi:hypothetical protein